MKAVIITCVLLFLASAVAGSIVFNENMNAFNEFQQKYGKSYSSIEEFTLRFNNFVENLKRNEVMNAKFHGKTTFGVNKFSDMSLEEFKTKVLMRPPSGPHPEAPSKVNHTYYSLLNAPDQFDWRSTSGIVTPVYDQGQCGSCWAFSATENIESRWALAKNPLAQLSQQQIVDCDTTDAGCNGGWPYNAYKYVIGAGGQELGKDYPYVAQNQACQFKAADVVAKPTNWAYATQSQDENAMANYLYANGPLSVCVDASNWFSYTTGVFSASSCGTSIDHCVLAVGYNRAANPPYWIVRNSWGTGWGQSGYMQLEFGKNACAVAEVATSAVI